MAISFIAFGTPLTLDAMIERLKKKISKAALNQRFNAHAAKFMKEILAHTLKITTTKAHQLDTVILGKFNSLKIIDSSSWKVPKIMKSIFPGFNEAGVKIQLVIDYVTGIVNYLDITEESCPDQKYASIIKKFIEAGNLLIFDLGYATNIFLNYIATFKAFFICRHNYQTHGIYIKKDDKYIKISIIELLKKLKDKTIYEFKCYIGNKDLKTEVKLIVLKVPQEVADKRRMKLKRAGQKRRTTPKKESLFLCGWSFFMTNIMDDKIEIREILALYKTRWTVELYFKQFKSIINIHKNELKKNEYRLQCEILGKLIVSVFTSFCYSIAIKCSMSDNSTMKSSHYQCK